MTKREMMNRYYSERDMEMAEISLKQGIEDGSIKLNGNEISGNTYGARRAIKAYFGARWNGEKKCWIITKDQEYADLIFKSGMAV